ncbi:putative ribosome biogenesis GTPase RsgA [Companilactobacillus sp. RD055328]|uniref:ribosome small subunit-dependent GTPase A n=1 Tax=Companilactobacillus sp. RD055328 TaxID=2916634 RepID=UPI001FC839F2|nr:ribosome small subunit-dependent GTPase A [Companilactobacillus sp. RD055328]GKQ42567.1 putative ribosome biogenesis GTPase RsgA [Companilactobacillus sp. RD055328]
MAEGKIISSISGFYDILSNGKVYRTRARGNLRKKSIKPIVGDNVEFDDNKDQLGYLNDVLKRKNSLIRPPMANVDQAIVVTSCVEPDFSAILLDKILLNLEKNNIHPIIYISKEDIAGDKLDKVMPIIKEYDKVYPVIYGSTVNIDDFYELFKDKVTVFTGQTGAGKSTLLNQIKPDLNLETAEISSTLNRGKHTTRQVNLFSFNDGLIADTPGFSSIDLREISLEDLPQLYPDFVKYSDKCKFRGCTHINEPSCAVKEELEAGNVSIIRYNDYKTIRKEIEARKPIYKKEK